MCVRVVHGPSAMSMARTQIRISSDWLSADMATASRRRQNAARRAARRMGAKVVWISWSPTFRLVTTTASQESELFNGVASIHGDFARAQIANSCNVI